METNFFLPKDLLIKKLGDFYLVFNPEIPNIVVVNEIGREIIRFFDDFHTIPEVLDNIKCKYKLDEKSVKELNAFIFSLKNAGFLYTERKPTVKKGLGFKKLTKLFLHLTNKCNLRCIHCHRDSGTPLEKELSTKKLLEVCNDFIDLGGTELILTGGEPLIKRKTLFKIIETARNRGIKEVVVTTNGTLLLDQDIDFFNKHAVKVAVSLDGGTPFTNDYIRGKGTYQLITKNIRKLVKGGIYTIIETTLMKPNIKEIEQMFHNAKNLNVNSIAFGLIMIAGRAEKNSKILAVTNEEVLYAYETIRRMSEETGIKTNIENLWFEHKHFEKRIMCGAGVIMLSVAANGDVYPCQNLHYNDLKAGNVRKKRLREIWENSSILEKFRKLSVLDINECKDCELRFICAGGCRANSYNIHGNLYNSDPLCPVYKKIYWQKITNLAKDLWNES